MPKSITISLNPDDRSIGFNNNKMQLKISPDANNGLSFENGKIVAKIGPRGDSSAGQMNVSGNGIGPINIPDIEDPLPTVGFNSSVSRHKKYGGDNAFLKENDGPVMTRLDGNTLVANGSIASWMIKRATGG